jgi:hypothetical protein
LPLGRVEVLVGGDGDAHLAALVLANCLDDRQDRLGRGEVIFLHACRRIENKEDFCYLHLPPQSAEDALDLLDFLGRGQLAAVLVDERPDEADLVKQPAVGC